MAKSWNLKSLLAKLSRHARVTPGRSRLLSVHSERVLRHVIPVLILSFLALGALVRFVALSDESGRLTEQSEKTLKLATLLVHSEILAAKGTAGAYSDPNDIVTSAIPDQMMEHGLFAVVSDGSGRIVAALPGFERYVGENLQRLVPDSQLLMQFGEQADVLHTQFSGDPASIASTHIGDDGAMLTFVQRDADLYADWRHSVSTQVSLFSATSIVMLMVLYAYFRQATRAQDADALCLETHQRMDTALSRGHCGLWDWDIGRGRMYWSRSMYEMVGLKPKGDVLSFGDIAPLLHPGDGSLFEVARKVASGKISQLDRIFRMRRADGDYVWLRARAEVTRTPSGEVHLIGVAVDVSEQQELARLTDEANRQLNSAIENISETFVLCDRDDRLVLCNSKYRETFGLSESDVTRGTPLGDVMVKAKRPIETQAVVSPTLGTGERASEALLADGRWLLLSERRSADGGFVSIGTDVTQLKRHQAQLSDSQRRLMTTIGAVQEAKLDAETKARQLAELNRNYVIQKERAESASSAKTTFLANMSHELRTPLNAILGFSEIMRHQTFGPIGCDKYGEYAEDIHHSGRFLLRLIDDILDMAKIEAGRLALSPEPVDLAEIVGETRKIIDVQAQKKSVAFTVQAPNALAMNLDRRAGKQILLNLLSNAVKYTDEGGKVTLHLRQVGDKAVITIADNGIGIPAAALQGLGRPFEQIENEMTRTNKGTGLGLAIARSLVELQRGRMRIFSRVGVGTAVTIRLPIAEAKAPRSETRHAPHLREAAHHHKMPAVA